MVEGNRPIHQARVGSVTASSEPQVFSEFVKGGDPATALSLLVGRSASRL